MQPSKITLSGEGFVAPTSLPLVEGSSTQNARFVTLMGLPMPKWQFYRDKLNQRTRGHEEWSPGRVRVELRQGNKTRLKSPSRFLSPASVRLHLYGEIKLLFLARFQSRLPSFPCLGRTAGNETHVGY